MSLKNLKDRALQNAAVRQEYEALTDEFALIDQLLKMRTAAGLTQEEVARRMGTAKSNICRLEKSGKSPKLDTIRRYADACGYKVEIGFQRAAGA
jgi:transcriptional regulator with XRE-family HTH domain